jgi:hypothetical protein
VFGHYRESRSLGASYCFVTVNTDNEKVTHAAALL